MSGKLNSFSRRQVLKAGAGAAAFIPLLGMPAIAQSKPSEILVTAAGGDWGEFLRKAYYDPFLAYSGMKVNHQPYMGLAELKAMVESRSWGQADILQMSAGEAAMAQEQGLSEPLDYNLIKTSDFLEGTVAPNYFLVNVAASVLAWNTDAFPKGSEPKSWMDFFNPKNTAPRGLFKNPNQTFEIAVMGAGVPMDKIYPIDIDLALKTLTAVRDTIRWYEGGAQSQQMIVGGEVDWAMLWGNRADGLATDKKPVDYLMVNNVLDGDALVIPKGHPKKQWAMEFAAYMATPEPQARLTDQVALGPTNQKALPLCDPVRLARTPLAPQYIGKNRFQDFNWLAKNGAAMNDAFNKWLVS